MFTPSALDEIEHRLDGIVQEDADNGIFRARRDMFTDEELFELEMKHIFEGNWIYMAHESQIPNPGDFRRVFENMAYAASLKKKRGYKCALGMQMVLLPENAREAADRFVVQIETVGGFVTMLFGRVPEDGESISHEGLTFEVERADARRILSVRVRRSLEADP